MNKTFIRGPNYLVGFHKKHVRDNKRNVSLSFLIVFNHSSKQNLTNRNLPMKITCRMVFKYCVLLNNRFTALPYK